MSLFGKRYVGGFMDQIRCDEPSYLVWKWHPSGLRQGENNREKERNSLGVFVTCKRWRGCSVCLSSKGRNLSGFHRGTF